MHVKAMRVLLLGLLLCPLCSLRDTKDCTGGCIVLNAVAVLVAMQYLSHLGSSQLFWAVSCYTSSAYVLLRRCCQHCKGSGLAALTREVRKADVQAVCVWAQAGGEADEEEEGTGELQQLDMADLGFDRHTPTLAAGTLLQDSRIVQVQLVCLAMSFLM